MASIASTSDSAIERMLRRAAETSSTSTASPISLESLLSDPETRDIIETGPEEFTLQYVTDEGEAHLVSRAYVSTVVDASTLPVISMIVDYHRWDNVWGISFPQSVTLDQLSQQDKDLWRARDAYMWLWQCSVYDARAFTALSADEAIAVAAKLKSFDKLSEVAQDIMLLLQRDLFLLCDVHPTVAEIFKIHRIATNRMRKDFKINLGTSTLSDNPPHTSKALAWFEKYCAFVQYDEDNLVTPSVKDFRDDAARKVAQPDKWESWLGPCKSGVYVDTDDDRVRVYLEETLKNVAVVVGRAQWRDLRRRPVPLSDSVPTIFVGPLCLAEPYTAANWLRDRAVKPPGNFQHGTKRLSKVYETLAVAELAIPSHASYVIVATRPRRCQPMRKCGIWYSVSDPSNASTRLSDVREREPTATTAMFTNGSAATLTRLNTTVDYVILDARAWTDPAHLIVAVQCSRQGVFVVRDAKTTESE